MRASLTAATSLDSVLIGSKVSKPERDSKVAAFLADVGKEPHSYWVLDAKTAEFAKRPGSLAAVMPSPPPGQLPPVVSREEQLAPYRKTAENYLALFFTENAKRCLAIFDFLMIRTPLASLNPSNLEFTLADKKTGGRRVVVNLFDYLHLLTSQLAPTKPLLDLHAYLGKYGTLPRCFIANRHRKFNAAA